MIDWPILLGLAAAFGLGRLRGSWVNMKPSRTVLTTPNWRELVGKLEQIQDAIARSQTRLEANPLTRDPLHTAHRLVGECIRLLVYRPGIHADGGLASLLEEVDPLGERSDP